LSTYCFLEFKNYSYLRLFGSGYGIFFGSSMGGVSGGGVV
jgi:hypothetical protein